MRRRIRIEIVMDGHRVVSSSCTETNAPLRGFWVRWVHVPIGNGKDDTQPRSRVVQWINEVMSKSLKEYHEH